MQRQILEHDVAPVAAPARDETAHHEIHLPATMTDLVGRASELAAVAGLLGEHRLVTLTGTAGTGKTRLAVEVARQAAPAYPDGVWFVDLAPVEGGEPVAEVVGATIGGTAAAAARPRRPCAPRSAGGGCCWSSTTASTCSPTPRRP